MPQSAVPLRLLRPAETPTRSATQPPTAPAATVPTRDRKSEAAWLKLGGSICRRAREIAAEVAR